MGIRGLTTFIANRSSQYLESYELHDTYLVVDGNSIACQLYKWHCKCNDCFGGDYDKYAAVIKNFFQLLSDCNITPLVVFDGAYEKRKLKTVYSRMRNKISASKDLNSVTEGRISVFPLFLRELFVDIVTTLNIKCLRCDFEGDSESAELARTLGCPIVSFDSDFFIFDVLYIPFSTMQLRLRKRKNVNYLVCEVYRIEKFLNSFGGLDKINLPLLAALLGNDYIKKSAFSVFYRQLKMHKTKQNEQQTQIKSVIVWLKNETPESALRKILGRYKMNHRRTLARRIEKAIGAYQSGESHICSYFNIEKVGDKRGKIIVPKPEDVEDLGQGELEEGEIEDEMSSSEELTPDEPEIEESIPVLKSIIPNFFRENYKKCQYPPSFMDMIMSSTYYFIPLIEDYSLEPCHKISWEIVAAIYKILTSPKTRPLFCVMRNEFSNIKRSPVPAYDREVPKLQELEHMTQQNAQQVLLQILKIDKSFERFPKSWQLFLIAINYWVTNTQKIDLPHVYSLILCAIMLNHVDTKVGFYRSTKSFLSKYNSHNEPAKPSTSTKNIPEALSAIDLSNSVSCAKTLIDYFQMDAKMRCYVKLFDRGIVHDFAQLQSCLLHIKYLNSLLNFPFPNFTISEFYDGTFLYNMTANLRKRTDLKGYMGILLGKCPQILDAFELMAEEIENRVVFNAGRHEPPRKRKKKKKAISHLPETELFSDVSDEEYVFDSNNKFSLLSFVNK
ncbi:protein asteroid [Tribolium castaneum]|uniref:Protein asteroid homolog 1-like Protein n=1 Tax=Tribolium castaneum TaxID=7070 RepID=D6WJ78_TRICA|nr:PREDICTED: protein asteroid [Tribolium castaneum]EFA04435.1 Protein asteroid homolog 1-like Protein [Tribolium castaneum]|eukprot:XP_975212.1 PREDICTED: protein asteroid [Tribolium castaneum]